MVYFINDIITGALIGLLYALVAMGFVVIYRASKVFNFAQGELVIIGGCRYPFRWFWPGWSGTQSNEFS